MHTLSALRLITPDLAIGPWLIFSQFVAFSCRWAWISKWIHLGIFFDFWFIFDLFSDVYQANLFMKATKTIQE
jgi:hypothetical protein